MKTYTTITAVLSMLLTANIIGCSGGSSSSSPGGRKHTAGAGHTSSSPNFIDERATIKGPSVEGHWVSKCKWDDFKRSWRVLDLEFTGKTVVRSSTEYTDEACTKVKTSSVNKGAYRFIALLSNNIYIVEYAFKLKNGATVAGKENLRVEDKLLYIADNASGEGMGVLIDQPLYLTVKNTDQKKPQKPVSTEPEYATNYGEVKYMVCNLQGNVLRFDLRSVKLLSDTSGTVRLSDDDCAHDGNNFWFPDNYSVVISRPGGYPKITFDRMQFTSEMATGSSQTGLGESGSFYSAFAGNSGSCLFLKNNVAKGVYQVCE